jgi:uncharacterized repeat protein (TIGR02543 family)
MRNNKKLFAILLVMSFSLGLVFQPSTHIANAQSGGSGGASSLCYLSTLVNLAGAGGLSVSSGYCSYGSYVTVTEYTNTGFVFDGWYLDGIYQGKVSVYTLQMLESHQLAAAFSKRAVSLTITVNPAQAAATAPAPGVSTYDYGDTVIVSEYPMAGYVFDGWYLDGTYLGAGTNARITMNGDHQLVAYFEAISQQRRHQHQLLLQHPYQQSPLTQHQYH